MAGLCFWGETGMACNLGYAGIVMLFFMAAIFRRQVAVNILNMNFDLIWSMIVMVPVYLILLVLLPLKFVFFISLFIALGGGFLGMIWPILPSAVE